MTDPAPTPYAEIVSVLDALPLLTRETRRARRLSIRGASKQAGVAYAVISRVENGQGCHLRNAVRILRWMDEP